MHISPYLKAGYSCLWVNTLEPDRAEEVLAEIAFETNAVSARRWDVSLGMVDLKQGSVEACPSPIAAITMAAAAPGGTVTFLWNFHRLLTSLEAVQAIQNAIPTLQDAGNTIVVLAPSADKLPEELARLFTVLSYDLPDDAVLGDVLGGVISGSDFKPPPRKEVTAAIAACRGLTAGEAQDALALALGETGTFDPAVIAREKAGALLRQTSLQLNRFDERFDDLGGLIVLKEYTLRTAPSPLSLGVLVTGIPGGGKSHLAKALGNELGRPCLSLDFGSLMGGIVGESERNTRAALDAVDAMGECVLFIDELEKGLAGAGSSGQTDSGVKAGVAATFLKWLSDRDPGKAYVVATSNNVHMLPPEYQRAERWDAVFFVDLPNDAERPEIWDIHTKRFLVTLDALPDDEGWSGAEIKACCRTAAMMSSTLSDAAQYIVPLSKSMSEDIEALRKWAGGRAVPASAPQEAVPVRRSTRRVRRGA